MTKLEEIENLRRELVKKIIKITDLNVCDFDVDISFSSSDDLIAEAKELGWHKDRYGESVWHTSKIPTGGEVTVFVDDEK